MQLHPHQVYHIYNRGNNRKRLFYSKTNYPYFLDKLSKYLTPHCDLLAYCLLPNHFHLLVHANDYTNLPFGGLTEQKDVVHSQASIRMSRFSHGVQMLLSSYAKAINKRHKRTGSLFTQNTHSKMTSGPSHTMDYTLWCFIYIHLNPVTAGLVQTPDQWPFSSYREYLGKSTSPICNIELGKKLLSLDINELKAFDDSEIPEHILAKIF